MTPIASVLRGAAGALALAAVTPAVGQTSEEIVVEGHFGAVPNNVRSLSQTVSYADLDISTQAGKDELRRRVRLTARFLCDKLGEGNDASSPLVPACRDDTYRNAMGRVGKVEEGFAPRSTTWVAGPAWRPPYPADWVTRYP